MDNKKQKRPDIVNPYDIQVGGTHYASMVIQPSEFINNPHKGGKQDLEKAKHFIDMIIERDYK